VNAVVELAEHECVDLLAGTTVGRVALCTPAGPRIVPVNHVLRGSAILFRTTADSELGTYAVGAELAFEVDHLDHERKRAWSVVALGRCAVVDDPEDLRLLASVEAPRAWAGGERPLALRLAWRELSGRRVGGLHWPHPVTPRGY
jgi:nitroimidazol reductase NimA-like FMN-containing flavoprotein (pyridoxamine 5'-phosphate oxidase superfamily)